MNIQITNIPNGQKIKSIDFKIEFDDSSVVTNTVITPVPIQTSPMNPVVQAVDCSTTSETADIPKMPDIDISNRPSKIPEEMLEESF